MGKLSDNFEMVAGTSGDEPAPAPVTATCSVCGADGLPRLARTSVGKWLAVHLGGCERETIWGDSSAEVDALWNEQQQELNP